MAHYQYFVTALLELMEYAGTLQTIWETLLHKLVPHDKLGQVSSIDLPGS
ncbi:MAG: hypothetical protein ACYDER_20380 [Ktedonobacteraceae bacterium]